MQDSPRALKVAVCISGQLRTFEEALPFLRRYLFEPLSPDVFIHTWSDRGETTQTSRMTPRWLQRLGRYSYFGAKLHARFVDAYDNTAECFPENVGVSREFLEALYRPRRIVIEDFPDNGLWSLHGKRVPQVLLDRIKELDRTDKGEGVKYGGVIGGLPMFYKIWACDRLRQDHECETGVSYDVIVRVRPDIHLLAPIPLESLADDESLHVSVPDMRDETYRNGTRVCDQMAWGGSRVMALYSSLWTELEDLYRELAIDTAWRGHFGGEVVTGRFARKIGLPVRLHHLHRGMLRLALNPRRARKAWRYVFSGRRPA